MALRDKMVERTQPFLDPGEQIRQVFAGQKISGWWGLLTWLIVFWNRYYIVAVTDRRIAILDSGKWSFASPKSLLGSVARTTRIGEPGGLWWKCESLGLPMWIAKRFHHDVAAADAALDGRPPAGSPLPPPVQP